MNHSLETITSNNVEPHMDDYSCRMWSQTNQPNGDGLPGQHEEEASKSKANGIIINLRVFDQEIDSLNTTS